MLTPKQEAALKKALHITTKQVNISEQYCDYIFIANNYNIYITISADWLLEYQ